MTKRVVKKTEPSGTAPRDTLVVVREFGLSVAAALTGAHVRPATGTQYSAVMVIIAQPPEPPLGGSLNYVEGEERWVFTEQLEMAQNVEEDGESGHGTG